LCLDDVRVFDYDDHDSDGNDDHDDDDDDDDEYGMLRSRRYDEPVVDAFRTLFESKPMLLEHLDASRNGLSSSSLWISLGQWLGVNPALKTLDLEDSLDMTALLEQLDLSFARGNTCLRDLCLSQSPLCTRTEAS